MLARTVRDRDVYTTAFFKVKHILRNLKCIVTIMSNIKHFGQKLNLRIYSSKTKQISFSLVFHLTLYPFSIFITVNLLYIYIYIYGKTHLQENRKSFPYTYGKNFPYT